MTLPALVPMLSAKDAASAIDFYQRAFGATVTNRLEHDGKVAHAQLNIGRRGLIGWHNTRFWPNDDRKGAPKGS